MPDFGDYYQALADTRPDVVSINTYPDTHAPYARAALAAGCHVFCEKPLAETVAQAQQIVDAGIARRRKLVVGYILRVHPAWTKFIELARTLGKPLVMRMNLNQQSHGDTWTTHRQPDELDEPHRRLRRPLRGCDVPDDRRAADPRVRRSAPGSPTSSSRACSTTASCRSRSTTAQWAGTRRAGDR